MITSKKLTKGKSFLLFLGIWFLCSLVFVLIREIFNTPLICGTPGLFVASLTFYFHRTVVLFLTIEKKKARQFLLISLACFVANILCGVFTGRILQFWLLFFVAAIIAKTKYEKGSKS